MRYVAIVDGEEREVEIRELEPERYEIRLAGRTLRVDARRVSDTTLSLVCDHQAYNIESEKSVTGGQNVLVRGHIVPVEVLDQRALRLRRAQQEAKGPQGPVTIRSPMPGKLVAVLVQEGQEVAAGQGLVVIEAMKMQNELRSPREGTVRQLKAREGTTVEGGVTLCVIEAAAQAPNTEDSCVRS